MNSSESLFEYLNQKLVNPIKFKDLNNLYFSIFCTTDILPSELQLLKITKPVLSKTFAKLANGLTIIEKNNSEFLIEDLSKEKYWIDLIDTNLKIGKTPDLKSANALL